MSVCVTFGHLHHFFLVRHCNMNQTTIFIMMIKQLVAVQTAVFFLRARRKSTAYCCKRAFFNAAIEKISGRLNSCIDVVYDCGLVLVGKQ